MRSQNSNMKRFIGAVMALVLVIPAAGEGTPEEILRQGARTARAKGQEVLARVRDACGLLPSPG